MTDLPVVMRIDSPALRAAVRVGAITEDEWELLADLRRRGIDPNCFLAITCGYEACSTPGCPFRDPDKEPYDY